MKTFLYIITLLYSGITFANDSKVRVLPAINLPKNPVVRNAMIDGVNGFISQINFENNKNSFVNESHLPETSVLMDELKGLAYNKTMNDSDFYKCYLSNVLQLSDSLYSVQLSYSGIKDSISTLRAMITLDVHVSPSGKLTFNSPLKRYTSKWSNQKCGNTIVYYRSEINSANAINYFSLVQSFDKKLNAPHTNESFYCCENFNDALRLIGVDYKSDYNGRRKGTLSSRENNSIVSVDGTLTNEFTDYDPHDLWHSRLHNIVNISDINKPVDEGSVYLNGGSWGATWKEISERFKKFAKENPEADWIALYNESKVFDSIKNYPLNIDYAINALITEKIWNEHGVNAFKELLTCGKRQEGNANYFAVLYKISGIRESDFNTVVWSLLEL